MSPCAFHAARKDPSGGASTDPGFPTLPFLHYSCDIAARSPLAMQAQWLQKVAPPSMWRHLQPKAHVSLPRSGSVVNSAEISEPPGRPSPAQKTLRNHLTNFYGRPRPWKFGRKLIRFRLKLSLNLNLSLNFKFRVSSNSR